MEHAAARLGSQGIVASMRAEVATQQVFRGIAPLLIMWALRVISEGLPAAKFLSVPSMPWCRVPAMGLPCELTQKYNHAVLPPATGRTYCRSC